jgi:hypothetical protein
MRLAKPEAELQRQRAQIGRDKAMDSVSVLRLLLSPFARLRDKIMGDMTVHVDDHRMSGQRSEPVVSLKRIWAENTTGQNTFVSDFEVELLEPVRLGTTRTEWREPARAVKVEKGENIPPFGRTNTVHVLAFMDGALPEASGHFKARVYAVGRSGFRRRPTLIEKDYDIRDL